ncbi:response regulator receiver domain-containing protein [Motilibacter peucedani]|uniref:Response regulator receiver domain-containing protein n=1 Tax=Motilibacter peucedani TaxID=598650 RepID=A0A420XUI5_9ACTN|nr:response regulator transcription factor [Motilibacter peucedani]RKS80532.1 response regulator receiver domain-containing protein [Motilibacter peucedani]
MTGSEVRVLVVDDQRPFRLAAAGMLRRASGFVLAGEAESGEQAVELAVELAPDLVLMDIHMPGMGGVAATARLRELVPSAVVFLCSTYARADLPAEVSTSGAAAYVSKEELAAPLLNELWSAHRPVA